MELTRNFKETVLQRVQSDASFAQALLDEAAGLVEASVLKSTLKENLGPINAANLRRAHKLLEEGHVVGKLVLEGWGA